jgi:hypothetical protein
MYTIETRSAAHVLPPLHYVSSRIQSVYCMHAFLSDGVGIFSGRGGANFLASPFTLCYTSLAVRGCSRYQSM